VKVTLPFGRKGIYKTEPRDVGISFIFNIMSSPQVEYRRLGKSGLRVSVPILGAMSFGTDKWSSWVIGEDEVLVGPIERRNRLIHHCKGPTAAEGGVGARCHDLGHGERVLERRVRADHRESDQKGAPSVISINAPC
jgi:hypothetical protein